MTQSMTMKNIDKAPMVGGCWDLPDLGTGTEVLTDSAEVTVLATTGNDASVPRHVHAHHDEFGLLVQGRGRVFIGDETHEVRPGSTWAIPRGVPHGGEYDGEFRVLVWFTPGEDLADPDRITLA